jgi:DNA-binding response OmpR family regulator
MKKRILVVDDEPAMTRMIKLNLEQTAKHAHSGWRCAREVSGAALD